MLCESPSFFGCLVLQCEATPRATWLCNRTIVSDSLGRGSTPSRESFYGASIMIARKSLSFLIETERGTTLRTQECVPKRYLHIDKEQVPEGDATGPPAFARRYSGSSQACLSSFSIMCATPRVKRCVPCIRKNVIGIINNPLPDGSTSTQEHLDVPVYSVQHHMPPSSSHSPYRICLDSVC